MKKNKLPLHLISYATFVATMQNAKAKALRERYANTSQEHCGNFKRLLCLIFVKKMHFQITVNKITSISLCPRLFKTQVGQLTREKN